MMKMLMAQKRRNETHSVAGRPQSVPSRRGHPGKSAEKRVWNASPPIHDWIPNHPQATIARISAGRLDPSVP
jgi:hypothetical protein